MEKKSEIELVAGSLKELLTTDRGRPGLCKAVAAVVEGMTMHMCWQG